MCSYFFHYLYFLLKLQQSIVNGESGSNPSLRNAPKIAETVLEPEGDQNLSLKRTEDCALDSRPKSSNAILTPVQVTNQAK